jgi:hypothetical protein
LASGDFFAIRAPHVSATFFNFHDSSNFEPLTG